VLPGGRGLAGGGGGARVRGVHGGDSEIRGDKNPSRRGEAERSGGGLDSGERRIGFVYRFVSSALASLARKKLTRREGDVLGSVLCGSWAGPSQALFRLKFFHSLSITSNLQTHT